MQQLSGQGLSALASVSWKLPAAVSRWLRVQRSFGSLSPDAVNSGFPPWRQAFASPTTRRRARPVRRLPYPRLPGSAVPREFLPRLPSRVSLLARPARPARSSRGPPPPPPRGQVPYWVRSRFAERGPPAAVLARVVREAHGGCLWDRGHWSPSGRCSGSRCRAASACAPRGAAAGGPRREQPRAVQPAPRTLRRLAAADRGPRAARAQPPHLRGRAAGSGLRRASGRGAERAAGCRQGAPARPPPRPAAAAGRCRRRGPRSTGRS